MALSSISSSDTCQSKSNVYFSFRGEDSRNKIASHLYAALQEKHIETFIDLECRQKHRQIVIPVFYFIDPSYVRNQSGSFAAAFTKHQQIVKIMSLDQVQRWKDALKEAANLSGFDSCAYKNECGRSVGFRRPSIFKTTKKVSRCWRMDSCSEFFSKKETENYLFSRKRYEIPSFGSPVDVLLFAVWRGDEERVAKILQESPESALESDDGGNTALHLACDEGNLAMVRLLIKSHPQLCLMKNKVKTTPLHIAVMRDREDLVSELLSACPESVMLVSATEETPLHAAIRQWQEIFLERCIESIQKRSDYVHLINKTDRAGNRQQFLIIRLLPSDKPSCDGKVEVNSMNGGCFTNLDILDVLPHEGMRDREIEMFLQREGALRARDSGKVKLDFSNNVKWTESQRNRDQSSHLQANWPMKTKHKTPRDAYHVLLITAAVILAITFHAALNAPGGKYKSSFSSSLGFQVGKQSSNYLLRLFIWFDSIAFITSAASMIIILMHEIPLKPWMLISVLSIYGAYICLIIAVSPRDALPVFLLGSPTILLASMSKHLALHSTLLKLLQFLWVRVYKK